MIQQPSIEQFQQALASFDLFMAVVMGGSFLLAWLLPRRLLNGRGVGLNVPLWSIMIGALVARVPLLGSPFWYDEAFTSAMIGTDWSGFREAIMGDVHPPLYYLIIRAFTTVFGDSDLMMRLPALGFSLLAIPVMYQITEHHAGKRAALWAAGLVAVLPTSIYYATEARYPAFLALTLGFAYLGLIKNDPWMFGGMLAAAAGAHVNAWVYVAAFALLWLVRRRHPIALLPASVAVGLWLPIAVNQAADVADGFWLSQYLPFRHLIEMLIGVRYLDSRAGLPSMLVFTSILIYALWQWRKNVTWDWLILAAGVPGTLWMIGLVWNPVYLPRTLIFSAWLLIIPLAWFLSNHASRLVVFSGVTAIALALPQLYLTQRDPNTIEAIHMCYGYERVYATNTHTAILARHFLPDSQVYTFTDGNNIAQQLPLDSRAALFDGVTTINDVWIDGRTCVIAQIGPFNKEPELAQLELIQFAYPVDRLRYDIPKSELVYYVAFVPKRN